MDENEARLLALLRFTAFAAQPESQMDLADGALLVAGAAYPHLDSARSMRYIAALAESVRAELRMPSGARLTSDETNSRVVAMRVLRVLRRVLADREGYNGSREDYYDPRNSYLNDVLERKRGIPISLTVLYLAVSQRIGAPLAGVGLPAHFVAKWPLSSAEGGDLYLDAFAAGEMMDTTDCVNFVRRLLAPGDVKRFDPLWFEAIGTRTLLTRMLTNLKLIYLQRGETTPALAIIDRLVALRPDLAQELRDRGLLRLALGEPLLAASDLAAYAQRSPQAPEMRRLRKRLASIGEIHNKLN